ncbi:hypothetical protein SESBI_00232 [Sesbania bispinosa]|nr:hypothetical protein SESBI_00232 [Sesbania bispinosa]
MKKLQTAAKTHACAAPVRSPDPLDSFPRLRVRESDGTSRRSSFGGDDSELERYCSANSVMGTPSTAMSMCSAITVFHDFSDCDFGSSSGFDDGNNNSLVSFRGGTTETNRNDRKKLRTQRNLRYGSSGLELYGDGDDELAITALDSSELIGFNRFEEPHGNRNESEVGERETEREEEDEDFSEGEESMYNYGSDGDNGNEFYLSKGDNGNESYLLKGDNGNEFYLWSSMHYHEEPEVRNENPLFMNASVAFGSHDLDDFLLQNGPVSAMSDLFRNQQENKNH